MALIMLVEVQHTSSEMQREMSRQRGEVRNPFSAGKKYLNSTTLTLYIISFRREDGRCLITTFTTIIQIVIQHPL